MMWPGHLAWLRTSFVWPPVRHMTLNRCTHPFIVHNDNNIHWSLQETPSPSTTPAATTWRRSPRRPSTPARWATHTLYYIRVSENSLRILNISRNFVDSSSYLLQVTKTSAEAGPFSWTAGGAEGVSYFVCGMGSGVHCSSGNMKLAVTVSNSC